MWIWDLESKLWFDYDLIMSSITSNLCLAQQEGFLPKIKTRYNVAIIPRWHFVYTGRLKAAWYKWLNQKWWKLSIIKSTTNKNWIFQYKKDIRFMWNVWKFDETILNTFETKSLSFSEWFMFEEFAYPRLLSQYNSIMYFDIWSRTPKKTVMWLLDELYKIWNIVFISDLHENLPLHDCLQLDEITLNGKKDVLMYDFFYTLAESKHKKFRFIWYGNTSDMDGNEKNTIWFATMVF